MTGVILYGPPAAGKDTVTRELLRLSDRYALYQRIKVGNGRSAGYRFATCEQAATLRTNGLVVYENARYNARYLIERKSLSDLFASAVPVIHLGQIAGIEAIRRAFPHERLLVVSLWCPRDVAAERIAERRTGDDVERLRVWDATERIPGDLSIDTATVTAVGAAEAIHAAVGGLNAVQADKGGAG